MKWMAIWLLGTAFYWLGLRHWLEGAYLGVAPAWFEQALAVGYPRFAVEKARFPIEFFLQKADQAWLRGSFLWLAVWLYVRLSSHLDSFWAVPFEQRHLQWLRRAFFPLLLLYTHDWALRLALLSKASPFYAPLPIFKLLHIPLLPAWGMYVLYGLFALGALMVALHIKSVWASIAVVLLFLWMQGYFYCFEKIDHGYATVQYVLMLWPWLLWEMRRQGAGWPLRLMQLSVALAYAFSALEKLLVSGLGWIPSFAAYIALHQAPIGLWVLEQPILPVLLPVGAWLWQMGFISCVFWPKMRWVFLPMGVLFHWGTYWLMGVGGYLSPWIMAYLVFLPESKSSKNAD